jgi:hypothetical protein
VSFQYSYTTVSSRDGRTHVQSNKTRFADGKLTRESFEGELEGDAYRQIVEETQRQMMSWFLPWVPRLRSDGIDRARRRYRPAAQEKSA